MTAIQSIGWMWQPGNKKEKQASLTIRLNLAIKEFQQRWGNIMPQCCFTSEELPNVPMIIPCHDNVIMLQRYSTNDESPDDVPSIVIPVYHDISVATNHLWLEFPEGFDFRKK